MKEIVAKLLEKYDASFENIEFKHLPTLFWLVSNAKRDRGTGRTFLLSIAFLKEGMANPGTLISVFDHPLIDHPQLMSGSVAILETIKSMGKETILMDINRKCFSYIGHKNHFSNLEYKEPDDYDTFEDDLINVIGYLIVYAKKRGMSLMKIRDMVDEFIALEIMHV